MKLITTAPLSRRQAAMYAELLEAEKAERSSIDSLLDSIVEAGEGAVLQVPDEDDQWLFVAAPELEEHFWVWCSAHETELDEIIDDEPEVLDVAYDITERGQRATISQWILAGEAGED